MTGQYEVFPRLAPRTNLRFDTPEAALAAIQELGENGHEYHVFFVVQRVRVKHRIVPELETVE